MDCLTSTAICIRSQGSLQTKLTPDGSRRLLAHGNKHGSQFGLQFTAVRPSSPEYACSLTCGAHAHEPT
jgi:hypothetical protein